jgi:hypothetical protein
MTSLFTAVSLIASSDGLVEQFLWKWMRAGFVLAKCRRLGWLRNGDGCETTLAQHQNLV